MKTAKKPTKQKCYLSPKTLATSSLYTNRSIFTDFGRRKGQKGVTRCENTHWIRLNTLSMSSNNCEILETLPKASSGLTTQVLRIEVQMLEKQKIFAQTFRYDTYPRHLFYGQLKFFNWLSLSLLLNNHVSGLKKFNSNLKTGKNKKQVVGSSFQAIFKSH